MKLSWWLLSRFISTRWLYSEKSVSALSNQHTEYSDDLLLVEISVSLLVEISTNSGQNFFFEKTYFLDELNHFQQLLTQKNLRKKIVLTKNVGALIRTFAMILHSKRLKPHKTISVLCIYAELLNSVDAIYFKKL